MSTAAAASRPIRPRWLSDSQKKIRNTTYNGTKNSAVLPIRYTVPNNHRSATSDAETAAINASICMAGRARPGG